MARKFEVPFKPDMRDCKMVVKNQYGTAYVMDTYCKNFTEEDKARFDAFILRMAVNAELRKRHKDDPKSDE